MKKTPSFLSTLVLSLFLLTACGGGGGGSSASPNQSPTIPTVTTGTVTDITTTTATSGGTVSATGGADITARGICWGTSADPTTSDSHTTDGTGVGSFSGSMTDLVPNTEYHVRAYATNSAGTAYGDDVAFTTANPAVTHTLTITVNPGSSGSVTTDPVSGPFADGTVVTLTATAAAGYQFKKWSGTNSAEVAANKIAMNADKSLTAEFEAATGAQWKNFSPALAGLGGIASLSGMSWVSADEGWIASSYKGEVYHTTDGGRTFTTQTMQYDIPLHAIHMVNANEGYAGGNSRVFHTTDGGSTWSYIGSCGNIRVLSFPPGSTTGYCGTDSGNIARITGSTITPMVTGVSNAIYGISAVATDKVWAVWWASVLYFDGVEWIDQQPGFGTNIPISLGNIFMVTDRIGWVVGDFGLIVKTVTGGETVNEQNAWTGQTNPDPSQRNLLDLHFINLNEGWAVGSQGVVLHTADGGANWSVVANGMTTNMLRSVRFTSSTNGYALGNNGTFLKFTDQDAPAPVAPTVITGEVWAITQTSASTYGFVTSDGASPVTARGVCLSTSANPTTNDNCTSNGTGSGSFFPSLTGLAPSTTYHLRAYATNAVGTSYGSDVTFTSGN